MVIVPQQPLVHSSTLERYPKPQTEHKGTNAKLGIPLYAPYKTLNKTTTHPQTQTTDEAQRACQPEASDRRHESKGYSSNFVSRVWGFGACVQDLWIPCGIEKDSKQGFRGFGLRNRIVFWEPVIVLVPHDHRLGQGSYMCWCCRYRHPSSLHAQ